MHFEAFDQLRVLRILTSKANQILNLGRNPSVVGQNYKVF